MTSPIIQTFSCGIFSARVTPREKSAPLVQISGGATETFDAAHLVDLKSLVESLMDYAEREAIARAARGKAKK